MDFTRQASIIPAADLSQFSITVIGAGGIGAATTLCLAKVGFDKITVYDHDKISEVNYPNQLLPIWVYRRHTNMGHDNLLTFTVEYAKVHILHQFVHEMTDVVIVPKSETYKDQPLSDIVICAVDNMKTRNAIWNQVRDNPDVMLYIDGRMAANDHTIYSIDMCKDTNSCYERTLYTDEEALEIPCTARATIYTNINIASLITDICVRWALREDFPRLICSNMRTFTMNTSPRIMYESY
jgi:tRNA A37 threonylcarbamoyladenosine dehydratase